MDATASPPIDYDALFAEADAAPVDEASLTAAANRLLVVSGLLARKGRINEAIAMAKLARWQFAALAARRRLEPKPPRSGRDMGDMRAWFGGHPHSQGRSSPVRRTPPDVDDEHREWAAPAHAPVSPSETVADAAEPAAESPPASRAADAPRTDPRRAAMMRRLRDGGAMTAVVHTHMGQTGAILRPPPTPPP